MQGGEVTAYTAAALNIQPILSGVYGVTYGAIRCVGTWIEVQSQYGVASNPNSITGSYATAFPNGTINLQQCNGYLADDAMAAFDVASGYRGDIRIHNCSFWAGVARTHYNINLDFTYTTAYCDDKSFGINFIQGIGGINGGASKVHYESTAPLVALSVAQNSVQSLPNGAWTKIQLQTKSFDTNNAYDNVTNFRFQPTVAGYYQINGNLQVQTTAAPCGIDIYKNGASTGYTLGAVQAAVLFATANVSRIVQLNGTTDYIELFGFQSTGGAVNTSAGITQLSAAYLRAA
jgi:hypothetical protein